LTSSALVLGVNGQDGSYLAEVLAARGHRVIGVGRQPSASWLAPDRMEYVPLDIADQAALGRLLSGRMPDQIYHLAAIHGPAGFAYEPVWLEALAVNVASVHTCLEHMRRSSPKMRLFYASSLKVFGNPPPARIDEATPRVGSCLYSITKNAATDLIHNYRARYGTWASVGYYFNHDSPRRRDTYFLPRLAAYIAGACNRLPLAPRLNSLDFWCDWGSSREFMEITADLLSLELPRDVVLATGQPVFAADLARELAASVGASLQELPHRAQDVPPFRAALDGLQRALGRVPAQTAFDVAAWILAERYSLGPQAGRVAREATS
jgi:GDPmannose 4,6-dehydratase